MTRPLVRIAIGLVAVVIVIVVATAAADVRRPIAVLRVRTGDRGLIRVQLPNDDANATTLSSILASAGVWKECDGCDDDDDGGGDGGGGGEGAILRCQIDGAARPGGRGGTTHERTLYISPGDGGGIDGSRTASELGLVHGSIITILPLSSSSSSSSSRSRRRNRNANDDDSERYDPFPHLAKRMSSFSSSSYRRPRGTMTYADVSRIRSEMHEVEPQAIGSLSKVYVCSVGASRFYDRCTAGGRGKRKGGEKGKDVENRVALLFGSIHKEALETRARARTSLSSTTENDRRCEVARVHAVWEPPNQRSRCGGTEYDGECLLLPPPSTRSGSSSACDVDAEETPTARAMRVASHLGLRPVGWMFSYSDDRCRRALDGANDDEGGNGPSLPVHGRDVVTGSEIQIDWMKRIGRDEGKKFVTLALDCGSDGAAEAFQLSDICVQMVAEGALASVSDPDVVNADGDDEPSRRRSARFISLANPVVVSGEETKSLDSVLLLVNLAMLSHVGMYSGGAAGSAPRGGNVKRGSGALLVKTRKRILAALCRRGDEDNDESVLKELCDFDVLLALDSLLGREDSKELCSIVKKYASGQRRNAVLGDRLRLILQSVLDR